MEYELSKYRVTDLGMTHLVKNCKHVIDLNLSGCKVYMIASKFKFLPLCANSCIINCLTLFG